MTWRRLVVASLKAFTLAFAYAAGERLAKRLLPLTPPKPRRRRARR